MGLEEIFSESMEQARDIPAEPKDLSKDFPPKLERDASTEIQAPKLERGAGAGGHDMRFGESVEARAARHELERAIEKGNKTAAEHSKRDLAEVLAKEAEKKLEKELEKKNKR